MSTVRLVAIALLAAAAAIGCAGTKQTSRAAAHSGFLDDYSRLEPGGKYELQQRWIAPGVDWASYDNIMVDPIQAWGEADSDDMDKATLEKLLTRFHVVLRDTMGQDYEITDVRTTHGLRIQIALTQIGASNPALDGVSTVLPVGWVASAVTEGVSGKPAFTGEMAMEIRVVDAETMQVLAKGVDTRVGGKKLGKSWDKWADVYAAMDTWAAALRYRLCKLRDDVGCMPPTG